MGIYTMTCTSLMIVALLCLVAGSVITVIIGVVANAVENRRRRTQKQPR